jgi:hypothetical protein
MKKILLIGLMVGISGCAMLSFIPSKWDYNEASKITDIQQESRTLNCTVDTKKDIDQLYYDVKWFETYALYKGSRDIVDVFEELANTVTELKDRSDKGPVSKLYCDIKKKIIVQQADITAKAVQGRFL